MNRKGVIYIVIGAFVSLFIIAVIAWIINFAAFKSPDELTKNMEGAVYEYRVVVKGAEELVKENVRLKTEKSAISTQAMKLQVENNNKEDIIAKQEVELREVKELIKAESEKRKNDLVKSKRKTDSLINIINKFKANKGKFSDD